jgi:RND family efflux transporter MFP subunit
MRLGVIALAGGMMLVSSVARAQDENGDLDCLIEPWVMLELSSPVEGLVETIAVERGDFVQKGQTVASLESKIEAATVEIARARAEMDARVRNRQVRLEYADRRLKRSEGLYQESVNSEQEVDEVRSGKRLAETELVEAKEAQALSRLELARAQAALDRRTLRSPVDGVVVRRIISPGEYADPPQVLEIAQINPLRVEVFAPVSMLDKVSVGETAQIFPEPPVGGAYTATVKVVDLVVDAASGTFGIRLELPNDDHSLPAGLKCKVRFEGNGAARE